jgi:hypothetical protein
VVLAGAITEIVPASASIAVCGLLGTAGAIAISLGCGLAGASRPAARKSAEYPVSPGGR